MIDADFSNAANHDLDIAFTTKMSQKMNVPRHIRLGNGDSAHLDDFAATNQYDGDWLIDTMSVPQRISAVGNV